jgi:large subunit ribosomal protein L17
MRHRVAHRKLGRVTEHRIAMLRNQAMDLLRNERLETTVAKAKELRPFVERLITVAKRSLSTPEGGPRNVVARRTVARDITDRAVVQKLFDTVAPRYVERAGGYTRLLRLGYRRGDSAELAQVELVGSEYNPNVEVEKGKEDAVKPKKRIGERIREALGGGGRKKADQDSARRVKPDSSVKGGGKVTTPRKAGGS